MEKVLRGNRVYVAIFGGCIATGAIGCAWVIQDWSVPRRMFVGALLGAGTALILTANRLIR